MSRLLFVIAVVMLAVFLFDRKRHRRALQAQDSWHCFRCGIQLNAGESIKIAVAGSGPFTHARVCRRCAAKDRTTQWVVWLILAVAFAVTIFIVAIK